MAEAVSLRERAPVRVAPRPLAPPPALIALLAATLVLGIAWALVLPAWQAPDENSHYGYVQSLVDGPGLPGDPQRPLFSTEQQLSASATNADQTAGSLLTKPEWDPRAFERYEREMGRLPDARRSDGGGPNPAASNPPVAYLVYAAPYLAASGGTPTHRLVWMRIVGLMWLLVTVAATWALVGEVFGSRPQLQLAGAAVPALTPMTTFISASVSPDGMLFATWTLVLWLGARMLRRGLTPGRGAAFLGAVGLACCVKATSYALLPGALAAIAIALWRARPLDWRRASRLAGPGIAALAGTLGTWIVTARVLARPASAQLTSAASASGLNVRELGSYLWQFYLPRLPFQQDFFHVGLPLYDIVLKGSWARFGWLEIVFPQPVYGLLAVATLAVVVGAVVTIRRERRMLDLGVAAFFALVALTLLAGLHWQEYRNLTSGAGPFMQGRYLLPLIGLAGLAAAAATQALPRRFRATAVGVAVGGLFAMQAFSLALLVERFYV